MKQFLSFFFLFWCFNLAQGNPFSLSNVEGGTDASINDQRHWHFISIHYLSLSEINQLRMTVMQCDDLKSCPGFYNVRTRQLMMKMSEQQCKDAQLLLRHWDKPRRAVLIKAKIVSLDKDYLQKLGVTYSSLGDFRPHAHRDQLDIPIFRLATHVLVNSRIHLLQQQGHATVIANPTLFTLDGKSATIESGSEIPYQQSTRSGATSIAFKKAVLKLNITPQIVSDSRVLLSIQINQDGISHFMVNGEPSIKTQQLVTHVLLKNNQTVLLGGIIHSVNSQSQVGIPGLRSLPVLGYLFRSNHQVHQRKELLLMVTPSILNSN